MNAGSQKDIKIVSQQKPTAQSVDTRVTELEAALRKQVSDLNQDVTSLRISQAEQALQSDSNATDLASLNAAIVKLASETLRLAAEVKELQATTRRKNSIPVKPDPQRATASIDLTVPAKVRVTWAPEPNPAEQSVYLQSKDGILRIWPLGPVTTVDKEATAEFDLGILSEDTIHGSGWQLIYTDSAGNPVTVNVKR